MIWPLKYFRSNARWNFLSHRPKKFKNKNLSISPRENSCAPSTVVETPTFSMSRTACGYNRKPWRCHIHVVLLLLPLNKKKILVFLHIFCSNYSCVCLSLVWFDKESNVSTRRFVLTLVIFYGFLFTDRRYQSSPPIWMPFRRLPTRPPTPKVICLDKITDNYIFQLIRFWLTTPVVRDDSSSCYYY